MVTLYEQLEALPEGLTGEILNGQLHAQPRPTGLHAKTESELTHDLVGSYGICVDISRTWWIGDRPPRPDMVYAMQHGVDHIMTNMEMLKPGVMIPELVERCHKLDDRFQKQKYSCFMHGVGLCDEWPHVDYPDKAQPGTFDYAIEPGMVLCVEVLVSEEGADFSIKLEDQVLITEDGYENLTQYPFDPALMGQTG